MNPYFLCHRKIIL